ncbi:MAG: ribosome biogenesis GTPase Der [Bacteroidota bacterium]|nr:ribosome biogenesis GTPase Der [Bacteroidota bacterium]MDP4226578.1 ribosome biogenesis GTPase Der [Bacteroidota bacterium]
MGNIVAIVGRPNVGKSTLFNRMVGGRKAIVDEVSGVTRDRNYDKCEWNGQEFSVIDTGGYTINSEDIFEKEIRKQVLLAIEEADVIIFVVDVRGGITDLDEAVADILRKSGKKVILTANKVDNNELGYESHEFYKFGLGEVYTISAITGGGTGDLLDEVVSLFPEPKPRPEEEEEIPKFAIVGRPNVGKSSLLNALIGEDRHIVTSIAGTTRDSIYTRYNKYNFDFYLVDTAGLRKKGKVNEDIEFYSVMRAVRTIENSDVCLLLIDATQGIEAQDMNIFNLIRKNKKGVVLLANKWDLIEKDNHSLEDYTQAILQRLAPFNDVPVIFTSAITKQRIQKVLEEAVAVYENRKKRISTSKLNEVMLAAIHSNEPPMVKGKQIKIKFVMQLPTATPSFAFFCNHPQYLRDPYKRYLENRLREAFNFKGVPIQIYFRQK